jgi:hypothetical protein
MADVAVSVIRWTSSLLFKKIKPSCMSTVRRHQKKIFADSIQRGTRSVRGSESPGMLKYVTEKIILWNTTRRINEAIRRAADKDVKITLSFLKLLGIVAERKSKLIPRNSIIPLK